MKELKANHSCNYCGMINQIGLKEINQEIGDIGREVMVTYYCCENCRRNNVTQIDDSYTIEDRNKLFKLITRCTGKPVKQSSRIMKEKLEKRLEERRSRLLEESKGKDILLKNGVIISKIN